MPVTADKTICSKPDKPLYVAIAEHIESQVASRRLTHGERLPSTAELAKDYGVTVSTLQQALASLAERGLLKRAPKKGTFVDASRYSLRALATFSSDPLEMESRFYARFLRAMEAELSRRGVEMDCQFGFSGARLKRDIARLEQDLAAGRYSFILAMAYSQGFLKWIEAQRSIPVFACSYFDASRSVFDGLAYLVSKGCRRIGFAHMGAEFDGGTKDMELDGLNRALRAFPQLKDGLEIFEWSQHVDEAYLAAKRYFLSVPRERWPDALFLHHDIVARGALIAMTELGLKAPFDIGVLTHANKGDGFQYPVELCRMEVDPAGVASAMSDFIEASMSRGAAAGGLTASPPSSVATLVEGGSVADLNLRAAGGAA